MSARRLRSWPRIPRIGAGGPLAALTASTTAFTLVIMGTTVVNVALPAIRADLGGTIAGLQWVINAYTLMLASLLLTMGALCDRRGAQRIMVIGIELFVVGAVVAAVAPSLGVLIAGQALLGLGAAALLPASLTLISDAHPDDRRRARAIAVFASASAVAIGLGPVLGGLLIDAIGWRAIFAADVPVALFVAALLVGHAAPSRVVGRGFDPWGQVTAFIALAALTLGVIESGSEGWGSLAVWLPLTVAVAGGAAFVVAERSGSHPMLPLVIFRSRAFDASALAGLLVNFGVYGQFFVLSLYLQERRGLSALQTGLIFLVQPTTAAVTALVAGALTHRRGPRIPTVVGCIIAGVGTLLIVPLDPHSTYVPIITGLLLLGAGGGLCVPAMTVAVVAASVREQVGIAAATFTASRQIGGILGVSVLGSLVGQEASISGIHSAELVAVGVFVAATAIGVFVARAPAAARTVIPVSGGPD